MILNVQQCHALMLIPCAIVLECLSVQVSLHVQQAVHAVDLQLVINCCY